MEMEVLTMIKRFLSIITALLITLGSGTASSYVFFTNIVKVLASETINVVNLRNIKKFIKNLQKNT